MTTTKEEPDSAAAEPAGDAAGDEVSDPAAVYRRTVVIPLAELTPFPGNAKRGDTDVILTSLRRNAQYRSLIVREVPHGPLVVLAGNHTMAALEVHGPGNCGQTVKTGGTRRPCGVCGNDPEWEPSARCEVITCDDSTARRINLVDNRAADLGTYDNAALAELLTDLGDDLGGTGYTDQDVERITSGLDDVPDEFPEYGDDIPTDYECPKCGYQWS